MGFARLFRSKTARRAGAGDGIGRSPLPRKRFFLLEPLEPRLLLGGDPFTFSAAAATEGIDMTLRIQEVEGVETLQLVDNASGDVVASQELPGTGAVSIIGSAFDDRIKVEESVTRRVPVKFEGGEGSDTLVGPDANNLWRITDVEAGTLNDNFVFEGVENLVGGGGNDVFRFGAEPPAEPGSGDPGGGDPVVSPTEEGAGSGPAVRSIEGGDGNDTLVGDDFANTWRITEIDGGDLNGIRFSGIENLTGGSEQDDFIFAGDAGVRGEVDGGEGVNTLDYSEHITGATVDLAAGEATGTGGARNFQRVIGSEGEDTLVGPDTDSAWTLTGPGTGEVNGVQFAGVENLAGGAGADTLAGPAADTIWTLTGEDSGEVAGVAFSGMENLTGAADNQDTFQVEQGGSLAGMMEGGAGGFDTVVLTGRYETVAYQVTGVDSGRIELDGAHVWFAGMEPVQLTQQSGTFTFTGTEGGDTITLEALGPPDRAPPVKVMRVSGTGESVEFANPTVALIIRGVGGDDTITLKSLDVDFCASLTVSGDGGTDSVTVSGSLICPGQDITIAAETITVNAGVTLSTRQIGSGTNYETSPSTGPSGDVRLEGITITIGTPSGAPARLLAHGDSGCAGGDITLLAQDTIASREGGFWFWPFFPLETEARVDLVKAVLKGDAITISSVAQTDSTFLDQIIPPDTEFPLDLDGIPYFLVGGYAVAKATAEIVVGTGTIINARTANLSSMAWASSTIKPLSTGLGVAYGAADPTATVTVREGARIATQGDLVISSNADSELTISVYTVNLGHYWTKGTWDITFAMSNSTITSRTQIEKGARLDVGGNLSVKSVMKKSHNVSTLAGAYQNGSVGVAVTITKSESTTEALVDGNVMAGGNISIIADSNTPRNDTAAVAATGPNLVANIVVKAKNWLVDHLKSKVEEQVSKKSPTSSTGSLSKYGVGLAVGWAIHDNASTARIGAGAAVTASGGKIDVRSSISDVPETSAMSTVSSDKAAGEGKNVKENAVAVSILVGEFTNKADAFIGAGAVVDAAKSLDVKADITIPLNWQWDDLPQAANVEFDPSEVAFSRGAIDLHKDHGFKPGQVITYDNGGGTDIGSPDGDATGGLKSGESYYVIVVNPTTIKLARTEADAQAGIAIENLDFSKATGDAHRFYDAVDISQIVSFVMEKLNTNLGLQNGYFTSWAQSKASGTQTGWAFSLILLSFHNSSHAYIDRDAQVNQNLNYRGLDQCVRVQATANVDTLNLSGIFAVPIDPLIVLLIGRPLSSGTNPARGVGGALLNVEYHNTVTAEIQNGVRLHASGLAVIASSTTRNISIAESGGKSSGTAINGALSLLWVGNDTTARIGRGAAVTTANGAVDTDGDGTIAQDETDSLLIDARDESRIYNISGGFSGGLFGGGGNTGIGISVATNTIRRNTRALIGDAVFNPSLDVVSRKGVIDLGYAHGFQTGQPVVYRNGGGSSIGGLLDGRVYYVIATGPTTIQLAASSTDAEEGRAIAALDPAVATGTSHGFRAVEESVVANPRYDTIDLGLRHGYEEGEAVRYEAVDGNAIGGLEDGRTYYVIFIDDWTIALADARDKARNETTYQFDPASAVGDDDVITLGSKHSYATGNAVVYDSGDGAVIGGLENGRTYYVIVAGENQIKLAATYEDATATDPVPISLQPSVATGSAHTLRDDFRIHLTGTEGAGARHRFIPVFVPARDVDSEAHTIDLGYAHPFLKGQPVIYRNGGGTSIGNLVDGQTYFVIEDGLTTIKLAASREDAQAAIPVQISSTGATGDAHRLEPVLSPSSVIDPDAGIIQLGYEHKFTTGTPVVYKSGGGESIDGLTDGETYYVIVAGPTSIWLAASAADAEQGIALTNLHPPAVTGEDHWFQAVTAPSGSGSVTSAGRIHLKAGNEGQILAIALASANVLDNRSAKQAIDSTVNSVIDSVVKKASGETSHEEMGIAGAGDFSINVIVDDAKAQILGADVEAVGVTLDAYDDSGILSIGGSAAISRADKKSYGIAGSVAVNVIASHATALIRDSTLRADLEVGLDAQTTNMIIAITASGSGAPRTAGIAVAGSIAVNVLNGDASATIDLGSSVLAGGSVSLTARDDSLIVSVAGAVNYGGKAGIGASIAVNDTRHNVTAIIEKSDVTALGGISLDATNEAGIVSVAAAIGGSNTGMAAEISWSSCVIDNKTDAHILGKRATGIIAGSDVVLSATDTSGIVNIAGNISFSWKGASFGLSVARSRIGNETTANIDSTSVVSTGGGVTLLASSNPTLASWSVGGSIASKLGFSGSLIFNDVENETTACVKNESEVTAAGVLRLEAKDCASVTSVCGGISGAGSVAIGFAGVNNNIGHDEDSTNDVKAYVENSAVRSSGGNVEVTATADSKIWALAIEGAILVGGSGAAAAGAWTANEIYNIVEAYVTAESAVTSERFGGSGGDITVTADDTSTIDAYTWGVSVALAGDAQVSIAVIKADNVIHNGVRAWIQDSVVNADGNVTVRSTSTPRTDSWVVAASISGSKELAIGVGGVWATNTTANTIEAYINKDADPNTRVTATGDILVEARSERGYLTDTSASHVGSLGIGISVDPLLAVGGSLGLSFSDDRVRNDVTAYIDAPVISTAGKISVHADSDAGANTYVLVTSVAAGFGAAGVALAGGTAEAFVEGRVRAYVGEKGELSAAGAIGVTATSVRDADAIVADLSVGGGWYAGAAIGLVGAVAKTGTGADSTPSDRDTVAYLKGTVKKASSLTIEANDTSTAFAWAVAASGGIGIGAGGVAGAWSDAEVLTSLAGYVDGGTVGTSEQRIAGDVVVRAVSVADADATADGWAVALGLGVSAAGSFADAIVTPKTLACVTGTAQRPSKITAGGSILVESMHNYVPLGSYWERAENPGQLGEDLRSETSAISPSVGLISGAGATATATIRPTSEAFVGEGAALDATGDTIVLALSYENSYAYSYSVFAGIVGIGWAKADADSKGTVKSHIDGSVTAGGKVVNVAAADQRAEADSDTWAYTLVAAWSIAEATVDSDVEAAVGSSAQINAQGDAFTLAIVEEQVSTDTEGKGWNIPGGDGPKSTPVLKAIIHSGASVVAQGKNVVNALLDGNVVKESFALSNLTDPNAVQVYQGSTAALILRPEKQTTPDGARISGGVDQSFFKVEKGPGEPWDGEWRLSFKKPAVFYGDQNHDSVYEVRVTLTFTDGSSADVSLKIKVLYASPLTAWDADNADNIVTVGPRGARYIRTVADSEDTQQSGPAPIVSVKATVAPTIVIDVAAGAELTSGADEDVVFLVESNHRATAIGGGLKGVPWAPLGIVNAEATVGGTIDVFLRGDIHYGRSLTLELHTANEAVAVGEALALGLFVPLAGTGVQAIATVNPVISTYVTPGSNITVGGDFTIRTLSEGSATAEARGIAGAPLFAVGVSKAETLVAPTVRTFIGEGARITAGGAITVETLHNYDAAGEKLDRKAAATAEASAGALIGLAAGTGAEANAEASPDVSAYVDQGAVLSAGTGSAITIRALASNVAEAEAHGISVTGAGALAVGSTLAEATVDGSTRAYLDGDVLQGGALAIEARGVNTATAESTAAAGGITVGSAAGSKAVAGASPAIEATIAAGRSVSVGGDVTIQALGEIGAEADATGHSIGAGLSGGVSLAEATIEPSIKAWIGSDAVVRASGNLALRSGAVSRADADASASGGSLVLAGAGAEGDAISGPTVATWFGSGSSVIVAGAIGAEANSEAHAWSNADGVSVAAAAGAFLESTAEVRTDTSCEVGYRGSEGVPAPPGSTILSGASITLLAQSSLEGVATTDAGGAGGFAGGRADASVSIDNETRTVVRAGSRLTATGSVDIEAASEIQGHAETDYFVIALFSLNRGEAAVDVTSVVGVVCEQGAEIGGDTVVIRAEVPLMDADTDADVDSKFGIKANVTADSRVTIDSDVSVTLGGQQAGGQSVADEGADLEINGQQAVTIEAVAAYLDGDAISNAYSFGGANQADAASVVAMTSDARLDVGGDSGDRVLITSGGSLLLRALQARPTGDEMAAGCDLETGADASIEGVAGGAASTASNRLTARTDVAIGAGAELRAADVGIFAESLHESKAKGVAKAYTLQKVVESIPIIGWLIKKITKWVWVPSEDVSIDEDISNQGAVTFDGAINLVSAQRNVTIAPDPVSDTEAEVRGVIETEPGVVRMSATTSTGEGVFAGNGSIRVDPSFDRVEVVNDSGLNLNVYDINCLVSSEDQPTIDLTYDTPFDGSAPRSTPEYSLTLNEGRVPEFSIVSTAGGDVRLRGDVVNRLGAVSIVAMGGSIVSEGGRVLARSVHLEGDEIGTVEAPIDVLLREGELSARATGSVNLNVGREQVDEQEIQRQGGVSRLASVAGMTDISAGGDINLALHAGTGVVVTYEVHYITITIGPFTFQIPYLAAVKSIVDLQTAYRVSDVGIEAGTTGAPQGQEADGAPRTVRIENGSGVDLTLDGTMSNPGGLINVLSPSGVILRGSATQLLAAGEIILDAEGIGAEASPIRVAAGSLEADGGSGAIWIEGIGDLTLGGPGEMTGLRADGPVNVSTSGRLTVREDVISAAGIVLATVDTPAPGEDLVVEVTARVAGASLTLLGGDDVEVAGVLSTAGIVSIAGDHGNADAGVGSSIWLHGVITGSAVGIEGEEDADIVSLTTVQGGSPTTVRTWGGNDIIRVGSQATPGTNAGGTVNGVSAFLVVEGGEGEDLLSVDDSGDAADDIGVLTGERLTGLGMGSADQGVVNSEPGIEYRELETLQIALGSGNDRFSVRGTSAATALDSGAGDDLIYVSSGADLGALSSAPATGDLKALHAAILHGTLDLVTGTLDIDAGGGHNTLCVSDRSGTASRTGIVITGDSISGLAPADILYRATGGDFSGQGTWTLEADRGLFGRGINLYAGSGGNRIEIQGVHSSGVLATPFDRTITTLFSGEGNDWITISAANGPGSLLVVQGQGGNDTIEAETAGLPLTIFGDAGRDSIEGGLGADRIFGDGGRIYYLVPEGRQGTAFDIVLGGSPVDETPGPARDTEMGTADRIQTMVDPAGDGNDRISGNEGDDLILGGGNDAVAAGNATIPAAGPGLETLRGDGGDDVVIGDHARVDLSNGVATVLETTERTTGGTDLISGGEGSDLLVGGAAGDVIDGGAGADLIFGDNVRLDRAEGMGDVSNPRFRAPQGGMIYDANGDVRVDGTERSDPAGTPAWADWNITLLDHSAGIEAAALNNFGRDYIAGGAGNDTIFGQLGDDTLQGDGSVVGLVEGGVPVSASRDASGQLQVNPPAGAATDGDDYIEGNGGNDLIFGGLGQDDLVGGSSGLFSLDSAGKRPDGSDLIFGGTGADIARNDPGDPSADGHARDADMIVGDNGNLYRLVGGDGAFLTFNYDGYGTARIIPRAAELLDTTPGGPDLDPAAAWRDIGAADEIHGGAGDDAVYGMAGNDVLFGEGQDDDLIGGWGNDWISGGTGDDGILGDDGRISTSRNSTQGEPLHGIPGFAPAELNLEIKTPGRGQDAIINVAGQLKKTVNLTPFSVDPTGDGDPDFRPARADDILYGGLGNDALHGGPGDDAISGGEALPQYYPVPSNSGNVLRFGEVRAGEFAAYDEYDPLRKILVDENGVFTDSANPDAREFLLNFEAQEGPAPEGRPTDGNDVLFGDLGNDWLVGGTGRDDLYGGWGSDLLNADDNHDGTLGTADPRANNVPDTHPTYEDRAHGGAGRDVLIANTGGDRLIDWVGEFNSYLVPFGPFGAPTISRSVQPQLMGFLHSLAASDGADPTRAADAGTDPDRRGEPQGELGLVLQRDDAWRDQTGAPEDPQAGNVPGGPRDVLRSANFNDGTSDGFSPDSGRWAVRNGRLEVSPSVLGGDAVSVFFVSEAFPGTFELLATVNQDRPLAGYKSNAFLVFDYQNERNFKFAGIDISLNKLQIGHRTAQGWIVDAWSNIQVRPETDYRLMLTMDDTTAALTVSGIGTISHAFAPRIDEDGVRHGLNGGMVGVGAQSSKGRFDNVAVQVPLRGITLESREDFSGGTAVLFTGPRTGSWVVGGSRYQASPSAGDDLAVSTMNLGVGRGLEVSSRLELETRLGIQNTGGVIFDRYGPADFKFVALLADQDQVVIGHHTARDGWTCDAITSRSVDAGTDYDLAISLRGRTVSVALGGQTVLTHLFNGVVVDGGFGLFTRSSSSAFDSVTVKTDDPAFETPVPGGGGGGGTPAGPSDKPALEMGLQSAEPRTSGGQPTGGYRLSGWAVDLDQQGRRQIGDGMSALSGRLARDLRQDDSRESTPDGREASPLAGLPREPLLPEATPHRPTDPMV